MECQMPQRPHTVGAIPKSYSQSEFIMNLLQEIENEARGPVSKPKAPPKNHMKENLKRLKEIQAQAKQKMAEKQQLQPLKVPNKYVEVRSKINNVNCNDDKPLNRYSNREPPRTAGPFRSQPPLSPCLGSKSNRPSSLHSYRSLPQLHTTEEAGQGSDILSADMKSVRSDDESVKSAHLLSCMKKKIAPKQEVRHRPGRIPNYLTERKKEWEIQKEKELKLREEASIPFGYTLLPDEERIETLELLKKNQEELILNLAALPVRNDTIRLRTYKEELEKQLAKVEEGIKIFSRPKVLIKNDA